MLIQTYINLEPNTLESQKTTQTVLLPKGQLIEILVRLLKGTDQLVHVTIRDNGYLFYADSSKDTLSTRKLVDVDAKRYNLLYSLNPIKMEVCNECPDQKAIVKTDFILSVSPDNQVFNSLYRGGK